jgi:hypothetical protein
MFNSYQRLPLIVHQWVHLVAWVVGDLVAVVVVDLVVQGVDLVIQASAVVLGLMEVQGVGLVIQALTVVLHLTVLGVTVIQVKGLATHLVKIDMADQALVVSVPLVQVLQEVDLEDRLVDLNLADKVVQTVQVVLGILCLVKPADLVDLVIAVAGIRMIENHFNL